MVDTDVLREELKTYVVKEKVDQTPGPKKLKYRMFDRSLRKNIYISRSLAGLGAQISQVENSLRDICEEISPPRDRVESNMEQDYVAGVQAGSI